MQFPFADPFWEIFQFEVVYQNNWRICDLPEDLLTRELPTDLVESLNPVLLQRVLHRRRCAANYLTDAKWPQLVCDALKLASRGLDSQILQGIRQSNLYNPLEDYLHHLYYFNKVADAMISNGIGVKALGPNGGAIHDLDKLDPLMLTAYAERFEDGLETELWKICVQRHVSNSPHHPEHEIWQDVLCSTTGLQTSVCQHCETCRILAVREVICDRVSRRVQKDLGGKLTSAAWNISASWFSALPKRWKDEAMMVIEKMKTVKD